MQRKTWYSILGLDTMPLSFKNLLNCCCWFTAVVFGNFNWVIVKYVPWLSYCVQACRCRGLAPYILVSFSLLRSWYDRKRYENPSSVARTTHYNAKGNILTFSLETYLIDFLKQTKFLLQVKILCMYCHFRNHQHSINRISEIMSCEEEAIFITAFEYMAYIREDLWEISANVNRLFGPFATFL